MKIKASRSPTSTPIEVRPIHPSNMSDLIPLPTYSKRSAPSKADIDKLGNIDLLNLAISPSGKILTKYKNNSGKPVKAFKSRCFILDDFNEISKSIDIRFTSEAAVTMPSKTLFGYVIPPNGSIYIMIDGGTTFGCTTFGEDGDLEDIPPPMRKRFKVNITDVIFSQENPESDMERLWLQRTREAAEDRHE